jgi:hypothetical protein
MIMDTKAKMPCHPLRAPFSRYLRCLPTIALRGRRNLVDPLLGVITLSGGNFRSYRPQPPASNCASRGFPGLKSVRYFRSR